MLPNDRPQPPPPLPRSRDRISGQLSHQHIAISRAARPPRWPFAVHFDPVYSCRWSTNVPAGRRLKTIHNACTDIGIGPGRWSTRVCLRPELLLSQFEFRWNGAGKAQEHRGRNPTGTSKLGANVGGTMPSAQAFPGIVRQRGHGHILMSMSVSRPSACCRRLPAFLSALGKLLITHCAKKNANLRTKSGQHPGAVRRSSRRQVRTV